MLIETTDLQFAEIAFAAGFASIRQFNDTIREVYDLSPTALRGRRGGQPSTGTVTMRLAVRTPYAGRSLLAFLATRAVPGVETAVDGWYARTLGLPHGTGTVRLEIDDHDEAGQTAFVLARSPSTTCATPRPAWSACAASSTPTATRCRRPGARRRPAAATARREPAGLRVPGHVDGNEIAVRAVLGQQVTVAAARTIAARLTVELGKPIARPDGGSPTFPGRRHPRDARARGPADAAVARSRAHGSVSRAGRGRGGARPRRRPRRDAAGAAGDPGHRSVDRRLHRVAALGDPDVFLPSDIGTRDALVGLGADPHAAAELAQAWRPWRSYAQMHLWRTLTETTTNQEK